MRSMKEYSDNDFLLLSGIQHFCFCRRQWALIHIEQQWIENVRTIEGQIVHQKAHDSMNVEIRNNIIISRGMPIRSAYLGFSGECDVVEFIENPDGIVLNGRSGKYSVYPVEYKRGHEKGYMYYCETRRRKEIIASNELRAKVYQMSEEMHQYYDRGYTPIVKADKHCNACSLKEICLPKMSKNNVYTYVCQSVQGEFDEKTT